MNVPERVSDLHGRSVESPAIDLSSGPEWDVSVLANEGIEDRILTRCFQRRAFAGASVMIVLTLGALLWWLSVIGRHALAFLSTTASQVSLFVGPVIVLGSMAALLALALLRFAFRSGAKEDAEPAPLTLLHGVVQQALDVGKDYLKGKRAPE